MWSTPCSRATSIVAVRRAVVDDQPLDGVEARRRSGQVAEGQRELVLLVETRNLDDELHARRARPSGQAAAGRPLTGARAGGVPSHGSGILGANDGCGDRQPDPGRAPALAGRPAPRARRRARAAPAAARDLHRPALASCCCVTFVLRLWGIKQGLPYSYNVDEATHFVPRAIAFFSHDLNPHYFLNPPAYSYLLHFVFELWFGSADAVARAYATDPDRACSVVARVVAAVLGTISVWLTYLAGARLFGRTVGAAGGGDLRPSPSCPSSTATWRSTTCPRWRRSRSSLYGIAGVLRRGRRARLRDRRRRHRAGRGDQVHGRDHAVLCLLRSRAAADGGAGAALDRRAPDWPGPAPRAGRVRARQPLRAARLLRVPGRGLHAGLAGRRRRTRSSSARRPAAGSPTTCGRSPGGWAGPRAWPRWAARCCCSCAGGWRWRWCCSRRRSPSSCSWATSSGSSAAG